MSLEGGCRCGAVRYRLDRDDLPPVYCCHCLFCQSGSGSAFSEQAVIPADSIAARGEIEDYRFERPDGSEGHHRLCALCHTRLWSTSSTIPSLALLRAGTLDRSSELVPSAHIWTQRKQAWVSLGGEVAQWPEGAPMDELAAALGVQRPGQGLSPQ
jgi:hypothetical protein